MLYVFWAVLLGGLSPAIAASQDTTTIEAKWVCPAPKGMTIPGDSSSIAIKVTNGKPPAIDVSALEAQIKALRDQFPSLDFSTCLENWVASIQGKIIDSFPGRKNKDLRNAALTAVFTPSSKYYEQTSMNGLRPYFPAMGSAASPPNPNVLKKGCGKNLALEHLDKDFVDSLEKNTKPLSQKCKDMIAHRYAELLQEAQCNDTVIVGGPDCAEQRKGVLVALESLHRQGFAPYLVEKELISFAICPGDEAFQELNRRLTRFSEDMGPVTNCVQLKPGDKTAIIAGDTGTGFYSDYALKRDENGDYVATLDLEFQDVKDSEWKAVAQKCFDQVNSNGWLSAPSKEDPTKTNKLKLELYDPKKDPKKKNAPATTSVWINTKKDARASSDNWALNMKLPEKCPTVIHEVMHLLGLVDDYHEEVSGFVPKGSGQYEFKDKSDGPSAYDCRVLGTDDSLMNSQNITFAAVQEKRTKLTLCSCTLPESSRGPNVANFYGMCSKSIVEGAPNKKCSTPATIETQVMPDTQAKQLTDRFAAELAQGTEYPMDFVISAEPAGTTRKSLLYPAQFNAIVQPGCTAQNADYYALATEAYRTSRKNGEKGTCSKMQSTALRFKSPWKESEGGSP